MDVNNSPLLNASDSVLVIVDIQQRLTTAMPNGVCERVIEQVKLLITAANVLSIPIMVTEQYPKGLGPTEPELINQIENAVILEKTNFSCAKADGFVEQIKLLDRKQVILVGMESHICILQTALDLKAQNFQIYVVEDAVSSRSKANQYNALQRMRHAGVVVINAESALFEWIGDAKHPEFKTLAKLIV